MPMPLVVDIQHWLADDGELPTANLRLRRNAQRIAQFIEYGGILEPLHGRETLLACRRRPRGRPCLGLIWVVKRADNCLETFCSTCHHVEAVISGWEDTLWADGPMEPMLMTDE
ncbi:MAG: hypothetical protein ACYC8T_14990 [Myxococcaceae bacterium]